MRIMWKICESRIYGKKVKRMKIEVTHQDMYEKGYREGYGKAMYEMEQKGMLREWIPVSERLPETDKKVLVNLHNTYGKDVILMASHIGYHERTSEDYGWQEFEGDTEYDEENDCFWIPECWCESNYVEDNANWIIDECEGIITHWMPLPDTYREEEIK